MRKDLPKSSWVDFITDFARDYEGREAKMSMFMNGDKRMIGRDPLVAFEGDCSGEIVDGVKIVLGEEGDNPDNLFHYVASPQSISYEEDETTGEIRSLSLEDENGHVTILEMV